VEVANDCVSAYGFNGEDPEAFWIDIDDTCEKARIHFGAADSLGDQVSTMIYAITDCNCDKVASLGYYQVETDDADSCHVACGVELVNPNESCTEITIYSECDFTGDSLVVTESVDCLTW